MTDDFDRLLSARTMAPPEDFAERVSAQTRGVPQLPVRPFWRLPGQSLPLGLAAALGALLLGEFVFAAFIAGTAQ